MYPATADSVHYRPIEAETLDRIRSAVDYPDAAQENLGLWARLWEWLGLDQLNLMPGYLPLNVLFWLLVVVLIGLLILLVFRREFGGFLKRSPAAAGFSHGMKGENGGKYVPPDPEALLASGDYREAVRLLMQDVLLNLNRAGIITLHSNKTDVDYRREIRDKEIKKLFTDISRLYEYSWYGGFEPGRHQLERAIRIWKELSEFDTRKAA